MKLALQIGIGIIIGIMGCWLVGIFFTASVVSALPHTTIDMSHTISEQGPIRTGAPVPAAPLASLPVLKPAASQLIEATGEPSRMLTRPEYKCIRDRSKTPVSITCVRDLH